MSTAQATSVDAGYPAVAEVRGSHVYILFHKSGKVFKIGKANSVLDRARTFGLESIDWGCSMALLLSSVEDAIHTEKVLQRTFRKWSVDKDRALEFGVSSDGSTEWFWSDCRDRLSQFLVANSDLLGFQIIDSAALAQALERDTSRRELAEARRQEADNKAASRQAKQEGRTRFQRMALAERTLVIREELPKILKLFMDRMAEVNSNEHAMFLGASSSGRGTYELLFLARTIFLKDKREPIWVDREDEEAICPERQFRAIACFQAYEWNDFELQQVSVRLSKHNDELDAVVNEILVDFLQLLRESPVDDFFYSSSAREVCEAAESFFAGKAFADDCRRSSVAPLKDANLDIFGCRSLDLSCNFIDEV